MAGTTDKPGNARLDAALRSIGLAGLDAARPYTGGPRSVPAPPPPPTPAPAERTVAARRDWLLGVQERQRQLSAQACGLMRARGLSGQAFLDNFYAPGRPVVIEGAIADWPALGRWTPDYLAAKVGSAPVEYQGGRSGAADFELAKDRHTRTMPFDAFIALVGRNDTPGNEAYITAYNNHRNTAAFAPLMADVRPIDAYLGAEPGMLWIGPAGTFTPLHFDLTNNMLIEVTGRKHLRLVPPAHTQYMYNDRHVFSAVHDLDDPARIDAHPLVRQATVYDVVLEPGDMLFIPIGWWHQVRALDFSVMMTATNFLWPNLGHESFPGD
ncbi:cupin-like domain-containing protein [Novosphingobium resinovorum]|uniref:cupin-like domain-containing protein n=1 Tax=Novosphingobium resinovorum TaxID=158500 RepID=UPI002ED36D46|nr:cupin-like domain-containing protein [Novosphingobium resinovorum]